MNPSTLPPEPDELGVEWQALFERVAHRIGVADPEAEANLLLGRYELREPIGHGGMGVVHRGFDHRLQREVAIKLASARPLTNLDKLRARLQREAQVLGKLQHDNVVRVYDIGEHRGEVFVAMELVRGSTLRDWRKQADRTLDEILAMYLAAGAGLAAAHQAGVIHRDFKPDNVLIGGDDQVRVGDFGLAHVLGGAVEAASETSGGAKLEGSRLTQPDEQLGTPDYMSPEQLQGLELDARTDQYSFCVALWEAITGSMPFGQDGLTKPHANERERLGAIEAGHVEGGEQLPRWLRRALVRGMAGKPEDRFASMQELLDALARGRGRKRRWARIGTMTGFALLGAAGIGLAIWSRIPPQQPCKLRDELEALEQNELWGELDSRVSNQSSRFQLDRLRQGVDGLALRADQLCRTRSIGQARHYEYWVADVGLALEDASAAVTGEGALPSTTLDRLRELEYRRFDRPPPTPLAEPVHEALRRSRELESEGRLDDALRAADEALVEAETVSERAEALVRRGRVRALQGGHGPALEDYDAAELLADGVGDDDLRLRAELLAAKTSIMRIEDPELARSHLERVEALFLRHPEPLLSPRRADANELWSSVYKRERNEVEALEHQLFVVLRHAIAGDRHQLGMALLNLGTVFEWFDRGPVAERCYRRALDRVDPASPGYYQAASALGHWLKNSYLENADDPRLAAEARQLLTEVEQHSQDLEASALAGMVAMAIVSSSVEQAREDAKRLASVLQARPPASARRRSDGWYTVALALVLQGDVGPEFEAAYAKSRADQGVLDTEELVGREITLASYALEAGRPELARECAARAREAAVSLDAADRDSWLAEIDGLFSTAATPDSVK